ncbi:MAG: antitoxin Xre/MbcA/ParS toxin-binding domain-containing protein [Gammaproteobacteria bacterium]
MKSFSGQDRVDLTRVLLEMLEDWGLNSEQTIHILGLPAKTSARKLLQYRNDYPLPEDENVDLHIEHLLGIADALRTMHPTNAQMGARWMRKPCRQFGGRPPLQVICESEGASGLVAVRSQIDCTFAWNLTGSNG